MYTAGQSILQYLLLPADGTMLGDPLHASTVYGTVPLDLLHFLQGEGDGDTRHGQLRPADVVLQTGRQAGRQTDSLV